MPQWIKVVSQGLAEIVPSLERMGGRGQGINGLPIHHQIGLLQLSISTSLSNGFKMKASNLELSFLIQIWSCLEVGRETGYP